MKLLFLIALSVMLSISCLAADTGAPAEGTGGIFETDGSFFDQIRRRRTLFAKTEMLRFLNEAGQTDFHLNFKIPNNELQFVQETQGLVANLNIRFNIYYGGALISENRFNHLAGARTTAVAQSANHYVLDKITFTLDREGFSAVIEIQDRNATTHYRNTFDLPLLDPNSIISDIEISHGISTELTPALDKFQRGQLQFYVDPIPVIDGNNRDFVVFYQVANISAGADSLYRFFEFIKVIRDSVVVWEGEFNQTVRYVPYPVVKRLPIGDWEQGLYTIEVTVVDPKIQRSETVERNFSLTRNFIVLTQRVFANDDDEFELISYFIDSRQRRLWRGLSDEGRINFIDRFWSANNPNPASDENRFLETVRMRVNEANWRFTHHRAGWRSDRGRIYIKHGGPDSIERRETDPDARYSRKFYQIWRYHGSERNYIFLDFQGNGNYRLIFARNDEMENIDPNWRSFLFGPGADTSRIDF